MLNIFYGFKYICGYQTEERNYVLKIKMAAPGAKARSKRIYC